MPRAGVTGIPELREVARRLKETADKKLRKELVKGLNKATKPLRVDIAESTPRYVPNRYAKPLSRSIKVRAALRGGAGAGAHVRITVKAKGKKEERDIRRINQGELRHPVFGRSRPGPRKGERKANPWVTQQVRRGLVDDSVRRMGGRVVHETSNAITAVAAYVTGKTAT